MTKEHWEVWSISLEYLAFFLAAPDFLGEDTLKNIRDLIATLLTPLDKFFKWAGDKVAGSTGLARNIPAGLFVLLVVGADAFVVAYFGIEYLFGKLVDPKSAYSANPSIGILVTLNVAAILYLLHLTIHGIASLGGKGIFFLTGTLSFTASKAIALGVVLEYLGRPLT